MQYKYIGRSGLRVSPICIGTMTFGSSCDKKEAFAILDEAYDKGINFIDTAEVYPVPPTAKDAGKTEEIGIHPVTLAVAYSKQFDFVASTIIGATSKAQLAPSLAAMDMCLSDEVMTRIADIQQHVMYPMG